MATSQTKFLRNLCRLLRPWIAEVIIRGIIPDRIGKYRVREIFETKPETGETSTEGESRPF
jgi:hypothetical protein